MMLPKYYHLKALGGSSTNSPRETLSSLTRSYLKHWGLEHKLPPRDAIVAHAILPKALGGSSTNSPRETLSSLTRSYLKHSGACAQTPPETRYHPTEKHQSATANQRKGTAATRRIAKYLENTDGSHETDNPLVFT